jgi:hypothetical protein
MKPTLTIAPFAAAFFGWFIANAITFLVVAYYLGDHPLFWACERIVLGSTFLTCTITTMLHTINVRPRTPLM